MIVLQDVCKSYASQRTQVTALSAVNLVIHPSQFVAIVGPSGSGKSTLMNIIGLLELPDSGTYSLLGRNVSDMHEDQLAFVRNRYLGFVFQSFNLIPRLSALQNVELPMAYAGVSSTLRRSRAAYALELVGLKDRIFHRPSQLSGGQQQRVAIARAISTDPVIIIADEPTGSLDSASARDIMEIFRTLNRNGKTVIVVTHAQEIAAYASRVIEIRGGMIAADYKVE